MAEKILMPKLSDTMEEGVIASWQVKVGDKIASDTIIAEIESDKSTMEQEGYVEGTVLYLVEEGSTIPVDGLIAIIGDEGENIDELLAGGESISAKATKVENDTATITETEVKTNVDLGAKVDNAKVIQMPKLSDTMEEGVIASWQVKVGEKVSSDTVIAEIESDKATMEQEAYEEGIILYLVEEGSTVAVDGLIAVIGEEGADYETLIKQFEAGQSGGEVQEEAKVEAKLETQATEAVSKTSTSSNGQALTTSNDRIKISPLARKLAEEKGFDITQILGTGDGGRIIKRDIESFVPSAKPQTQSTTATSSVSISVGTESFEDKPLSQMRKTIAKRLGESKFSAPHFYLTMEINMDEAMKARKQMNEISPVKISFNDLVVKACAMALKKHPAINADWLGDKIRYNHHIHVGVAVAVDEGLLVPVVRFTDTKPLSVIAGEVKELAGKARDKKLQPEEWQGNTFSISNLGMFGIEEFTAIINPPNACIMAVGGIKQVVVPKGDSFGVTNVMKVTLSCDHRIVDGATGAAFLQTVKQLLESPVSMLV